MKEFRLALGHSKLHPLVFWTIAAGYVQMEIPWRQISRWKSLTIPEVLNTKLHSHRKHACQTPVHSWAAAPEMFPHHVVVYIVCSGGHASPAVVEDESLADEALLHARLHVCEKKQRHIRNFNQQTFIVCRNKMRMSFRTGGWSEVVHFTQARDSAGHQVNSQLNQTACHIPTATVAITATATNELAKRSNRTRVPAFDRAFGWLCLPSIEKEINSTDPSIRWDEQYWVGQELPFRYHRTPTPLDVANCSLSKIGEGYISCQSL